MKNKTIILVSILFSCLVNSYAQTNYKWAPIGAKWQIGLHIMTWNPSTIEEFLVEKDTIFNGVNCKKILRTRTSRDTGITLMPTIYSYQNDSTEDIYYYNYAFKKFTLLYDFSAKLGDTIEYYFPLIDTITQYPDFDTVFKVVVEKIGFAQYKNELTNKIDNIIYRQYKIQDSAARAQNKRTYYYVGVAESIGATPFGFLPLSIAPLPGEVFFTYSYCYTDSFRKYNLTRYDVDCDGIPLSSNVLSQNKAVKIYPNIVINELNIENNSNLEIIGIEVFDYYGKKVISKQSVIKPNEIITIETDTINSGNYFVRVLLKNGEYLNSKIIK